MPTMSDIRNDVIFGMFKGEPGTRKSTAALSFPTPQYWASHDKKMQSLITPMKNWGILPSEIEYDDYSEWSPFEAKLKSFQLNCKYRTIIMDSITSGGDSVNLQTLNLKVGTTTGEGKEAGKRIGGIPVNTLEDYKAEASAFSRMIALLKDIHTFHHVNIILIAHVIGARHGEIADGSTHFSRIIVTGGQIISAKIPAYCTEVYHFNVERSAAVDMEGGYGLFTVHTGNDFARTSLPLPRKILFNNDPLYSKYILPAIQLQTKLQPVQQLPVQQPTKP